MGLDVSYTRIIGSKNLYDFRKLPQEVQEVLLEERSLSADTDDCDPELTDLELWLGEREGTLEERFIAFGFPIQHIWDSDGAVEEGDDGDNSLEYREALWKYKINTDGLVIGLIGYSY